MPRKNLSASDTGYFRGTDGLIYGTVDYTPALPSKVKYTPATHQQVMDAIRSDEAGSGSPTLDLAKQGLYDPNRSDVIFHPQNNQWIAAIATDRQESLGEGVTTTGSDTYELERSLHDTIVRIITNNPHLALLNINS